MSRTLGLALLGASALIACWTSSAHAEIYAILVAGGQSQQANFYGFYNEVRHAYEALRAQGKTVRIVATDGTWKVSREAPGERLSTFSLTEAGKRAPDPNQEKTPSYPPIDYPATSLAGLQGAIKSLSLAPNDQLLIYFIGHGEEPLKPQQPETAVIKFWGRDYTWQEVGNLLQEAVLPTVEIKIAAVACHGGGVHAIARALPNACSSSFVPFFSEGIRLYTESMYGAAFWSEYTRRSGQTSFGALAHTGQAGDLPNLGLGAISSFDYVDFVTRKGPYTGRYRNEPLRNRPIRGKHGEFIYRRLAPVGYQPNLRSFSWSEWRRFYEDLIEQGRTLREVVLSDYRNLPRAAGILRNVWAGPSPIHRALTDGAPPREEMLRVADRFDRDQDIERPAAALARFAFFHEAVENALRLQEFNARATAEEKRKFAQLARCEWSPFGSGAASVARRELRR